MINFRKNILLNQASQVKDYIQDGLIFNLDGTDKQALGNIVWRDKAGGYGYENLGGVQEIENGFKFNGTNSSLLRGECLSIFSDPSEYTIEFVFSPLISDYNWAPIISFNGWDSYNIGAACKIMNNNVYVKHSTDRNTPYNWLYNIGSKRLMTVSIPGHNQKVIANLVEYSNYNTGDGGAFSNKNFSYVGGRVDGSAYKVFTGNIYAIRLYHHALTKEEMLYNQNIDIEKYKITI